MTFKFFKDVGALGTEMRTHWFSDAIDEQDFGRIVAALGFRDVRRRAAGTRMPNVERFFSKFGRDLAVEQARKWSIVAPIAAEYAELRDPQLGPDERHGLWREFATRVADAGLYQLGGWAPLAREEDDVDEDAYDCYDW